ncbi:MAG TPA: TetR/AcrR family transcriptional regulator [Acidimicrobiales bacterium]
MTDARTTRQERAAATGEQLLAAARGVFEERGYVATTVGAITEAANTAHGTFYLHFRNKEDAFARVMAAVASDLDRRATVPWTADPRELLGASVRGYLAVYSAHQKLWRCVLEGMHQSPVVERMWLSLRRPFIDHIERILEQAREAGTLRGVDERATAHALGAMVEWSAFCHVALGEPARTDTSLDELAHTLTDLWFHAVYDGSGAD